MTAGQISGPKTPPPARQQELWNTVFGENYEQIGDEDDLEPRGKPIWVFALAGTLAVALIAALAWAFLAGPFAGEDEPAGEGVSGKAAPSSGPATTRPQSLSKLPRFPGNASPVAGTLTDSAAAITLPRLGGPWQLDSRPTVKTTYGFATRQYVAAGRDNTGKAQYAQVMSGPLPERLKARYSSPENLSPVISAVAFQARQKLFPPGNQIRKIAQQALAVQGLPGELSAWQVTAGQDKTTMVVAALSTGEDLPAIIYMSVPESKKQLLPDVNTVFRRIGLAAS
ncbi:hypothetical protein [Sinosporangium album]|uniref:hypothetical protein n=1 Tax=Sinosporangium album TaxID=504805 RepID=UPI000B862AC2|nr:hypothetical protein [Sinosporangium album]